MARLNLYRLVKDPWSSVARGDAIVLINRLFDEKEETRIDTTADQLTDSLRAYQNQPSVIDMYPYLPQVGTGYAANPVGLSYSSPHRAVLFNSEDGNWRVIDPFRGDGSRGALSLEKYLQQTVSDSHRIVLAVAPVQVRTFSDTYTNTLCEDITRGAWEYMRIPGAKKHGFIYSGVEKAYTTDQGNIFLLERSSSVWFPLNVGVGSCAEGSCSIDDVAVIEGRISEYIDTFGSEHGLFGGVELQGIKVPTFESV